ncbi:cytochrome c biogenesis protein ResB [Chitinimonas lacunae]|uniref:Cytochrome c biogenesis protein ResB n=1 Tax=Chitinimonas lacunae TaxID=1963018 RepID=A0ABV8MRX9_9NEIS
MPPWLAHRIPAVRRTSFARALYELFSSMRFAIALLTVIAIASVIGTVLKQNEPYPNYVVEFGEFWFQPFEALGLYDVYHAGWFLLILAFLVISTSACIYRQLPGILRDIRQYREQAGLKSLRAMPHHHEWAGTADPHDTASRAAALLQQRGYRFRAVEADGAIMLAAKKGSLQRLGYLFAHAAIVVICVGGLIDGNLPLKVQEALGWKQVETRNVPQSQIGAPSRLSAANLSFRGSVEMPEGGSADVVFVNAGRGYFVQELPFVVRLRKFHIEHYSTGQPKLFASDIEVVDKTSGKVTPATIKVNHPLIVDGIAIYQSNFGDGGSPLEFAVWDWFGHSAGQKPLKARSQSDLAITLNERPYKLEFSDLRVFNIEQAPGAAPRDGLDAMLEDVRQVKADKRMRNLGPTIQFKLRDERGQAREYLNYLAPFEEDGRFYLMSGVREEVGAPFSFVRIPLDRDFKPDTFMRLRATLFDAEARREVAKRATAKAREAGAVSPAGLADLERSLVWVLERYAEGGFAALESFLDSAKVPQDKRATVAQTYIKLLQGAVVEAMALAQQRAGLAPVTMDESHYRFLMDSLVAISASFDYGSPIYLQPTGFTEVKSSGLQLTRSPGKNLVYLGSLLLVLGILFMFYVREQRVWLRLTPQSSLFAFSCNRKDSLAEREFAALTQSLAPLVAGQEADHV